MLITGLLFAAATASKWLLAGKIMTTLGTGLIAIAPAVENLKNERK